VAFGFRLRQGSPDDFPAVMALIEGAAAWLSRKGTRQWQEPWPDREARDERVLRSLNEGETWLLWDAGRPVATVTARLGPDRRVWPSRQWNDRAVYLHQLVVARDPRYAGRELGARLFDWAGWQACLEYRVDWVRIDVWTDNVALHRYYEERGFVRAGRSGWSEYPSGMLFQKKVEDIGMPPPLPFTVEPARHGPLRGIALESRHAWWRSREDYRKRTRSSSSDPGSWT
jgi:ribosomal protein S18 acetylase RimI-like enzyme